MHLGRIISESQFVIGRPNVIVVQLSTLERSISLVVPLAKRESKAIKFPFQSPGLVKLDPLKFLTRSKLIQAAVHKVIEVNDEIGAIPLMARVESIAHNNTIADPRLELMLMFILCLILVVIYSQTER